METIGKPRKPVLDVRYEGKSITADISQDLLRFVYVDKRTGEADEIELSLDNTHGRWLDGWYPTKGDRLTASLGYEGEPMLPCGEFEIDQIEADGPPDQITIKGLSTAVTKALRTKQTRAYKGMTLKDIAHQVAQRQALTLTGEPDPIQIGRATQNQETDLGFLKRLADRYGHMMSVRGDQLYMAPLSAVDDRDAVLSITDREQLLRYHTADKTGAVYKSVTVSYLDPKTGQLIEHTEHAPTVKRKRGDKEIEDKSDTLKLNTRAENKQQAVAMAKAALRDKNLQSVDGEFTLHGDRRIVAGNTLNIAVLGKFNGDYLLSESKHTVTTAGGWEATATGQRLRIASEAKAARARRKQQRQQQKGKS